MFGRLAPCGVHLHSYSALHTVHKGCQTNKQNQVQCGVIAAGQGTRRIWRRRPMKQAVSSWARRLHSYIARMCHLGRSFWYVRAILGAVSSGVASRKGEPLLRHPNVGLHHRNGGAVGLSVAPSHTVGETPACYVILTRASQERLFHDFTVPTPGRSAIVVLFKGLTYRVRWMGSLR